MCIYQPAYLPQCTNKNLPGQQVCKEHAKIKCSNPGCENQAVAECGETGSLVCGAPYCKACGTHKNCWYKRKPKSYENK